MYTIKKRVGEDEAGEPIYEDVEPFEEQPAPAVTLGGRLQALMAETGVEHVAVPVT